MAFFFTFLFITTAYITPGVLFGPLGPYHVEVILAAFAILASIPSFSSSGLLRLPQTYAVLGICFAVVGSIAASGWLGGIPQICYGFLPVAAGFFLTAVNCRKKWHLQLIVLSLVICSTYFIARGAIDLQHNAQVSAFLYHASTAPRLRGLGYVNDPNDFAQVMVSLIPLVFLWRSKSRIANIFLLGIPIAVLLTGMYLTHSRGSSIALMAIVLLGFRKKIGTVPAVVLAALLMVAVSAVGWGGGRDIGIDSGEGRLDAWAAGMQYIKSHPLFGIGYQQFADVYGITAHNSVMVCAAEIGLPGFFSWILFLLVSFRFTIKLGKTPTEIQKRDLNDGRPSALDLWATKRIAPMPEPLRVAGAPELAPARFFRSDAASLPTPSTRWNAPVDPTAIVPNGSDIAPEELRRISQLLFVSLAGFLTAGWFLSRALSIWLFMYCGMVCAILRMAEDQGISISFDPAGRLIRWSFSIGLVLILVIYLFLRVHNVIG